MHSQYFRPKCLISTFEIYPATESETYPWEIRNLGIPTIRRELITDAAKQVIADKLGFV